MTGLSPNDVGAVLFRMDEWLPEGATWTVDYSSRSRARVVNVTVTSRPAALALINRMQRLQTNPHPTGPLVAGEWIGAIPIHNDALVVLRLQHIDPAQSWAAKPKEGAA